MARTRPKPVSDGESPQYAYALAVLGGGAAFVVSQSGAQTVAWVSYAVLGLLLAMLWPRKGTLWGLYLCLPVLLLVLINFMVTASVNAFLRDTAVLLKALPCAWVGAYVGSRLSPRRALERRAHARSGRKASGGSVHASSGRNAARAEPPRAKPLKPALVAPGADGRARPSGARADLTGLSVALIQAAHEGDPGRAGMLLASGADVDASVEDRLTPLIIGGDFETVKALFGPGGASGTEGPAPWTALMIATIKGHAEVARALVEAGADLRAENRRGWTALRFAVSMDETEILRLLLGAGAAANVADQEGRTPLMQAACENLEGSLRALIDAGADTSARDLEGRTALSLARERGHAAAVRLLQEAGASPSLSVEGYAAGNGPAAVDGGTAHRVIRLPGRYGSARGYDVIPAGSPLPQGCEETGREGSEEECRDWAWKSSIDERPEPGWLLGFMGLRDGRQGGA